MSFFMHIIAVLIIVFFSFVRLTPRQSKSVKDQSETNGPNSTRQSNSIGRSETNGRNSTRQSNVVDQSETNGPPIISKRQSSSVDHLETSAPPLHIATTPSLNGGSNYGVNKKEL